jgi:hypothetical protein
LNVASIDRPSPARVSALIARVDSGALAAIVVASARAALIKEPSGTT